MTSLHVPGSVAALATAFLLTVPAAPLIAQDPDASSDKRPGTYYDAFSKRGAATGQQAEPSQQRSPHHRRGAPSRKEVVDVEAAPRIAWTNPDGGLWSEPSNWGGGEVPGRDDHAVIDQAGTYTVVLDLDTYVAALTLGAEAGNQSLAIPDAALVIRGESAIEPQGVLELNGGRITGDGDLRVHGVVSWSGGAMSGRGAIRVAPDGRLELVGDERKVLSLRHLESSGRLDWQGEGNLVVTYGARIVNRPEGVFEIRTDALLDLYGPPGSEVHNDGTLRVLAAAPTFEPPLVNTGRLELEGASLELTADFSQSAGATLVIEMGDASSAPLRIAGGATLDGALVLHWRQGEDLRAESWEVVTFAAHQGGFASFEGLETPGGRQLEAQIAAGGLTIR